MVVTLLICSFFTLLLSEINAYYDSYLITVKNISPNHFARAVVRGLLFVTSSFILSHELIEGIVLFVFQSVIFWLWFDISLNLKCGIDPYYIGKTAFIDKKIRRFKISGKHLFIFKIAFLLGILAFIAYLNTH